MTELELRARPEMSELPTYGRPRPRTVLTHRLSSNESPFPPVRAVRDAVSAAAASVNRYPPLQPQELIDRLAHRYGVAPEQALVGGGSLAVLEQLVRTFAGPGDEVIYGWRSYEAYPIVVGGAGARAVEVTLADGRLDLEAMLERITDATRIIIICNPNNPTGAVVAADELDSFLARVPGRCLVVLDEAYREFVTDGSTRDGLELAALYANVAVLRTFSKAYGLAGLRVGYAIAAPGVVDAATRIGLPFAVSATALAGACAALDAHAEVTEQVVRIVLERERLRRILECARLPVQPSAANFLWLPLGDESVAFTERCARGGVAVRCFPGEGVRISVGTPESTDALAAIMK